MPIKLLSESMDATITDEDTIRIERILSFWFRDSTLSAPQIDARMEIWFGDNSSFDQEIEQEFADDVVRASEGELQHWADQPRGCLALILLLDQFRRNIYRNTPAAFEKDRAALKLCVEGAMAKADKGLTAIERVFFFMPLQHAESRKVQAKSVALFRRLAKTVSGSHRETFETIAQFAELHNDIVQQFGRFPHRNKLLGRENTAEENEYLSDGSPSFGQGG
jgi:uncharacterized protein (DUF924 family)